MATISSKKVKTGMILADDVHDVSGRLLVEKGTMLSDTHLKVLKTWGVAEVNIESSEVEEPAAVTSIPDRFIEQAKAQLAKRLARNDLTQELMSELYGLAVIKIANDLMNETRP